MTATGAPAPSLSIVVEWENAKLSELDRAFRMLQSVTAQAQELRARLGTSTEMIILYDGAEIDPGTIGSALEQAELDDSAVAIRLEAVEGLDYYGQKNAGAELAGGDFVLFVDSDVVPDEGWLATLFENAVERSGSVVGGNTYLDGSSFIGRSFGLFWFFPLRDQESGVERANNFFANSVIFPRDLILRQPFRPIGVVRGQCVALAQRLREDGIAIWRAQGARASHPAPNGLNHLIRRALCEGHDAIMIDKALTGPHPTSARRSLKTAVATPVHGFVRRTRGAGKRIVTHRRAVKMPLYEVPAAIALAAGYYALFAVGEVVSTLNPAIIPNRVRV